MIIKIKYFKMNKKKYFELKNKLLNNIKKA